MENIKIGLLEDNEADQKRLFEFSKKLGIEKDVKIDWTVFNNAKEFKDKYKGNEFQILLMDIELPDGNGLEIAKYARNIDSKVMIIFVTNMAQFALKGYEVHAFDFIVKPVTYDNFKIKIISAFQSIERKTNKDLLISNKEGKFKISINDLLYIEVSSHLLIFHTKEETIKATGSLNDFIGQLSDHCFSQCNRCYLVNLNYVSTIEKNFVIMSNGDKLQISRMKHASFVHSLNDFYALN